MLAGLLHAVTNPYVDLQWLLMKKRTPGTKYCFDFSNKFWPCWLRAWPSKGASPHSCLRPRLAPSRRNTMRRPSKRFWLKKNQRLSFLGRPRTSRTRRPKSWMWCRQTIPWMSSVTGRWMSSVTGRCQRVIVGRSQWRRMARISKPRDVRRWRHQKTPRWSSVQRKAFTLELWVFKLLEFWGPKIRPKPVCLQSGENLFVCSHGQFFCFLCLWTDSVCILHRRKRFECDCFGFVCKGFDRKQFNSSMGLIDWIQPIHILTLFVAFWQVWKPNAYKFQAQTCSSASTNTEGQTPIPESDSKVRFTLRFQSQIQRSGSQARFYSKSNSKSCLLFFIGHFQNLRHQSANQKLKPTCIDQGGAQAARPAGGFQFEPNEANLWGKWFF